MGHAVAVSYLFAVAEQLDRSGADPQAWLRAHGMSLDALSEPSFVLDWRRFETLVLDAEARSGEPALGMLVGQQLGILVRRDGRGRTDGHHCERGRP